MYERYEHISAPARRALGLPFGCDDNDVARAMLLLMGREAPVAVLGDTAIWFRQVANECTDHSSGFGDASKAAVVAREVVAVLPRRSSEIMRIFDARSADELEVALTEALQLAGRSALKDAVGCQSVAAADYEVDALEDIEGDYCYNPRTPRCSDRGLDARQDRREPPTSRFDR